LTVTGETSETGMLIMTVADLANSGGTIAPQDNILTYQASPGGSFLINAYDLPGIGFQDTKFVWAFVGFDESISLPFATGDYDRDGDVDDDDYAEWQSQFALTGYRTADGNGDMTINAADFVLWRDNLGAGSGSGEGNLAAVPEPSLAAMLLILALFSGVLLRQP
jgi:hypothetical protein